MAKVMNKISGIMLFILLTGLFSFSFAEEQLTITTYYPSPAGSYYNLYVSNSLGIGTTNPSKIPSAGGSPVVLQIHGGNNYSYLGLTTSSTSDGAGGSIEFGTLGSPSTEKRLGIVTGQSDGSSAAGTNGRLMFYTTNNGTIGERMRIDKSGNVGIGTTAPSELLHVYNGAVLAGTAATNGSLILAGQYSGANNYLNTFGSEYSSGGTVIGYSVKPFSGSSGYASSTSVNVSRAAINLDGDISFLVAGVQAVTQGSAVAMITNMIIKNGGNVGIGTTSPRSYAALDVNTSNGKSIYTMDSTNGGLLIGYSGSNIQARQTNDGNAQNLILQQWGGNVGIGTANPGAALDVYSATAWSSGWMNNLRLTSTTYPMLRFYAINNNKTSSIGNNADGGLWFGINGTGDVYGTYGMVILPTGYVGIGTIAPGTKLEVVNSVADAGAITQRAGTLGGTVRQYFRDNSGAKEFEFDADFTRDTLFIQSDTTTIGGITRAGNVGIGTTSPTDKLTVAGNEVPSTDAVFTSGKSGQRWSAVWASNGTIQTCFLAYKNITSWKPFSDYLYLVPRPVQYTWKSGDNREHLGYIGDDLPQIAKVDKDGIEEKAVIAILCGAVRQLEEKVKGLEAEISGLKGKL